MRKIDLVTIVHPEDKRTPKYKYTFKAPANSGIQSGDYVIADIKDKEVLGKVVSVLTNIEEEGELMKYVRSISTIENQKLKPIKYKLEKVRLEYHSDMEQELIDTYLSIENLDEYLNITRKENLRNTLDLGTNYFTIEQRLDSVGLDRRYKLYVEEYTYTGNTMDNLRIEIGNIFFDKNEAEKIIEIISENVDDSKFIDIKKELKKIM